VSRPETARFFTCANCGLSYQAANTEQDAATEMLQNCHEVVPADERISVCDDCYPVLLARAREKGLL
jgi:hypothetical protein